MRAFLEWLGLLPASPRNVRPAAFVGPVTDYVFENKRQPDGWGASRYAFETLGLVNSSPIQGAVRVRRQILFPFQGPQVWAGQALKIDGIPSQAGGIFTGGMVKADGSLPALGSPNAVQTGLIARNDPMAGANIVAGSYGPNNPL